MDGIIFLMKGGLVVDITLTAKQQIFPTDHQIDSFKDTMNTYTQALNFVSRWIFDHDFNLKQFNIHKEIYHTIRETFHLKSQLTQNAIRDVIARYKTVESQLKSKSQSLEHLWSPIEFKTPQLTLTRDRDYSFLKSGEVSINTNDKREKVEITFKNREHFLKGHKLGEAKLIPKDDKWFLYISATKEYPAFEKKNVQHVVGIDRGLRFLVNTYDEIGKTHFISGKEILAKRRHFKKLRQSLQKKNTKSAKRRIREIGQRENRWMTDVNHQISKALVDYYGPNTLFVLEDLINVRFATEKHRKDSRYEAVSWAFYQFEQHLAYKARMSESEVLKVDAHYTSQRCPGCGTIDKENRLNAEHIFCCKNCQYKSNDDRVASMNIQQLGTEWVSGTERPRYTKVEIN